MNRKIKIQHSLKGRIRFKIQHLRKSNNLAERFEQNFKNVNGVYWVRVNARGASLIIRYDQDVFSKRELFKMLVKVLPASPAPTCKKGSLPARSAGAISSDSLTPALQRFLGLSLLAGWVLIREVILKRPLAHNFLSPLGLITALAALPLVKKGLENLQKGRMNLESFLGGSIIAAVVAGETTAALEILWITSGGELLQGWITERSRRGIRDILQVTEKQTYVLSEGVEISTPVQKVQIGDTVVLHTGEKIAVDGQILKGEALIDESPITGRSEPADKSRGQHVYAGTFVCQGVIFVQAEKVGDHTYLARILRMVEDSLENKAPIESLADRLARNLVKTGFMVTLATLFITRSFWRAFSVMLVMACPCATIMAASTAVSAAINSAARRHILIKGGRYLEEAGRAKAICFDKTGTLTTNRPELKKLYNLNGLPENELLQLAYSTEIHNSHPLALAIKAEARKRGICAISHDICEYFPGKGVRSEIAGAEILVGSHKLMEKFSVHPEQVKAHLEKVKEQGLTLVFIARDGELLGVAGFANQERDNVQDLLSYLRRSGFRKTAMLTGDSKYSALDMAKRLDFDECHYSVLPEEKAAIIAGMRKGKEKVFMIGDGINDALALAEADIGLAMGAGGSEVAIEAADIALVQDDLQGVLYVHNLSQKTIKVVHQNFWIATGSNIIGVTLGALGLLSPVMAGMVHITHTLGILANSGRLLFVNNPLDITHIKDQPQNKNEKQA
jgi:cation-transporting P-type ATPase C